ncbi:hypothetical protein K1719_035111 [Acacia pycnantha]|nr:hypothetical protein K1719_035111 [Acacia pycnantha]
MDSLENKVCDVFMGEEEEEEYSAESELNQSPENFCDELQNHHQAERTLFWESQEAMLQEIIERYNVEDWELREEVGQILKEAKKATPYECNCRKPDSTTTSYGCSHCLRKLVVSLLSLRGYNASLRFSKWDSTNKFPGGSHEYIEVMMPKTQTRKKQMPYLIELELRDQFEIAKAGEEYKKLLSLLPESYIGKPEYMTAIIRVMCGASKRSMKEKKIHMGPWRKSSFMQMKWSARNNNNNTCISSTLPPSFHLMTQATNEACNRVPRAHTMIVT